MLGSDRVMIDMCHDWEKRIDLKELEFVYKRVMTKEKDDIDENDLIRAQHVFYRAVHNNNIDAVAKMLKCSYLNLINNQDLSLRTPLHYAAFKNNIAIARILLSEGADVSI